MKYKIAYGTDVFGFPYTTFIEVDCNQIAKYRTVIGIPRKRLTRKTVISILNEDPPTSSHFHNYPNTLMESLKGLGRARVEYEV